MEQKEAARCRGYDLYLEALEWYALLDQEVSQHDSLKIKTLILSSADESGRVSSRSMTISGFDEEGFVFFTNKHSRKASDFQKNPQAALCAYWNPIKQQVSIEGHVKRVDDETADRFWQKRERDSQLSSWASQQSQPLNDRQKLLNTFEEMKSNFRDAPVPRPTHWIGYRLVPLRFDFWRADWHRPGVRTQFEKVGDQWMKTLLYP